MTIHYTASPKGSRFTHAIPSLHLPSNRKNATDAFYYGGPQLSHQNKLLTSNSNHSHQIQITHSKFKSLTANSKSLTSNSNCSQQITNPPQQITNRSHQIQIAHSKYKSLTASTNTVGVKGGLRTADCGLRTADCGLRTSDFGLRTVDQGKKQTEGKMQTAD